MENPRRNNLDNFVPKMLLSETYFKHNINLDALEHIKNFLILLMTKIDETYPYDFIKNEQTNKFSKILNVSMNKQDNINHFKYCFEMVYMDFDEFFDIKEESNEKFMQVFMDIFYKNKNFDLKTATDTFTNIFDWSKNKTKEELDTLISIYNLFSDKNFGGYIINR